MNPRLTLGLWNVQWASSRNRRGMFFREHFDAMNADVLCLTEGYADLLPQEGYSITSHEDYGYPIHEGRRKVLLWSRRPWRDIDIVGDRVSPSGRFVAATTDTPLGPVCFIGVCIPWKDAHVRTGRSDRRPWEDHVSYIAGLSRVLRRTGDMPVVLLGDFNQRIPRERQPVEVHEALMRCMEPDLRVITAGRIPDAPHASIDHVAVSSAIAASEVLYLSASDANGAPMSDHYGLRLHLQLARESWRQD